MTLSQKIVHIFDASLRIPLPFLHHAVAPNTPIQGPIFYHRLFWWHVIFFDDEAWIGILSQKSVRERGRSIID